jgi:DNA (cytosine-5)-methyltransferase 1
VVEGDVRAFSAVSYRGIDLLAGGVPCPPFSIAGKQLGADDERDLFPEALRMVAEARPAAVMLENVRGLLGPIFADYRAHIDSRLAKLGYVAQWKLLHASDFGVPQLRPRVICVALKPSAAAHFSWPVASAQRTTVGEALLPLMAANGWQGAEAWADSASTVAPTLVGGSKKHGGPDLGPTRAKKAWRELGVDGMGLADAAPGPDFAGLPRLTVAMVARLQGFPADWQIAGRKTVAYRQVGNAFPPPVAAAVATQITAALDAAAQRGVLRAAA